MFWNGNTAIEGLSGSASGLMVSMPPIALADWIEAVAERTA
jgi:hypothetical protein